MRFASRKWLNSLAVKVLLAYVAGAVLTASLVMLAVLLVSNSQNDAISGAEVTDTTKDMADDLVFDSNGMPVGLHLRDFDGDWIFDSLRQETAYRVLDSSGNIVLSSPRSEVVWPQSSDAGTPLPESFSFTQRGVPMHGATERVEHGGRIWYLQFTASTRFFHLVYHAFALPFTGLGIVLFSVILLLVFGACVYVTLRYTFKPLRDVSNSAASISPRSLHARLQTDAIPDEIAPLVDSFNKVLERLEHGYRVQQEFLATAAHELKTPLALIRAQIELMAQDNGRVALLNDVEHMTRQVHQLLHLAEASEIQSYRFERVNIREVTSEAVSFLQRMADTAQVRLMLTGAAEPTWRADRGALFTLLKNLLENAIQHAPLNSDVHIEIGHDTLTLRDWGPGVNTEQLAHIFTRFWRGAHRRDHGAGLGLTICQEIATAHGWKLEAHRTEPGLLFALETGEQRRASSRVAGTL